MTSLRDVTLFVHETYPWLLHIICIYYIKLQFSLSVCLSVPPPPFFLTRPSDRNQIWHTYSGRYGTHSELKKVTHPTPEGSHWGVGFFLGGHKIKSAGNVINCPENPKQFKTRWGVGWGGVEVLGGFRGSSPSLPYPPLPLSPQSLPLSLLPSLPSRHSPPSLSPLPLSLPTSLHPTLPLPFFLPSLPPSFQSPLSPLPPSLPPNLPPTPPPPPSLPLTPSLPLHPPPSLSPLPSLPPLLVSTFLAVQEFIFPYVVQL